MEVLRKQRGDGAAEAHGATASSGSTAQEQALMGYTYTHRLKEGCTPEDSYGKTAVVLVFVKERKKESE